jgi:DNA-binding MarR family transcriptional regulator
MPKTARNPQSGDALALEQFLPYRLSVLANTISMHFATTYQQRFSLTIPEWRVMAVLAQYPEISAVDVAERTAMDKVAVSRAVQALLRKGHVQRDIDAGDRRRSMLELSASGRAVYRRVVPLARHIERDLLTALKPAQRKLLDELLTKLMTRAQELE